MDNQYAIVTDPLGNEIYFPQALCNNEDGYFEGIEIYDKVEDIIARPALIIRLSGADTALCYYRSIGFGHNVLIKARAVAGFWMVFECVRDPDSNYLFELMSNGTIAYENA